MKTKITAGSDWLYGTISSQGYRRRNGVHPSIAASHAPHNRIVVATDKVQIKLLLLFEQYTELLLLLLLPLYGVYTVGRPVDGPTDRPVL